MPERTITEDMDDEGAEGQAGDSNVIKSLRAKLRDAEAKAKAAEQAVSGAREQVKRELEIGSLVSQAGYPGLSELAVEKVKDATPDAVSAFLKGLGLEPKAIDSAPEQPEEQDQASKVAGVANLGQRVAAAASGKTASDITARIASAKSQEELIDIAREGGFLQQ
jgi:uncharacterized protein YgfB (UPF0149 family)